jgi:hypothetical protein
MNNKAFKYIKYLSYLLFAGGVAVLVYFLVMSIISPEPSREFAEASVGAAQGSGVMLAYSYVLIAIAIVVALIFPLINIVKNPKGSMRSLLGLLLMVIVLGVGYLLSSADPVVNSAGGYFEDPATLKLTDTGLYATYFMMLVAFGVIIFGEIKNAIKK